MFYSNLSNKIFLLCLSNVLEKRIMVNIIFIVYSQTSTPEVKAKSYNY